MATKGTGHLQMAGRYLACKLRYTNPFPFLPMTVEHWTGLPYEVEADINYANEILQNPQYDRRQLVKIIRYAKVYLCDKSLICTNFVNLNYIL